ncbi:MAG: AtpZ/AtpI family protein [Nitrospirae bacterium]|nr:AtpZ/AtpI family protein [Nitrospirota bacterium]
MGTLKKKPSPEKKTKSELFRFLGVASTVGINLVISTFIGFALGYYVMDRLFDSSPWFTIILTILGIVAGFKYLFKIASRIGNDNNSEH